MSCSSITVLELRQGLVTLPEGGSLGLGHRGTSLLWMRPKPSADPGGAWPGPDVLTQFMSAKCLCCFSCSRKV